MSEVNRQWLLHSRPVGMVKEPFIVLDYLPRFAEASAQLLDWVREGKITWQVDVQKGFENAPKTLQRLFTGANTGKQLLAL